MDIKELFSFNSNDPGFGQKFKTKTKRVINKDGSFNVQRLPPKGSPKNYYHHLISMSWTRFLLLNLAFYIFLNIFFALVYMLIATGHLYGLFSRPSAKIIYSDHAIIAPYRDINALEFRIANLRSNTLIDMQASVMFTRNFKNETGEWQREYFTLDLERNHIHFFPLTWTIVHPITESSPLYSLSKQDFLDQNAEILILIKGFDDTFAQQVNSRYSYLANEVLWGRRFERAFNTDENGDLLVELDKIDNTTEATLNV